MELRQSVGFVSLFGSLVLAAITVWTSWKLADEPMATLNESATLPIVQQSVSWTDTLLTYLPFIFVLMAVVGGIAFVVFEQRVI